LIINFGYVINNGQIIL